MARSTIELAFSLRLAISLSSAIGHLHQRGINHKDIKPAHVLVNSDTGQCWLRGFGIASRLPRERQAPESPSYRWNTGLHGPRADRTNESFHRFPK